MISDDLASQAQKVLEDNNRYDQYTVPAIGLYPHQWLWDSCFIAIGQRHYDVVRAQQEILSLLRGQWANGMIPNMVFTKTDKHRRDSNLWRSWQSPLAPDDVATSGITQPPVLAEAVVKIGEKLSLPERRMWYQTVYKALVHYHSWLYTERDPRQTGMVFLVHPWESGLDNTPPWMYELHQHSLPWWVGAVGTLHLDKVVNFFRRDVQFVPAEQRLSTIDILALYSILRRLRRKTYDTERILSHSLLSIEDLTFNSILIRNNQHLQKIAKIIKQPLPDELMTAMKKAEAALEELWDPYQGQYFSRNYASNKLIKIPSIATLMPLYAGSITKERAEQLVRLIIDKKQYGAHFPVPSTPLNSEWYREMGYWQGPTWVNTNGVIIDGLERYGYHDLAAQIREQSLNLVKEAGFYEYFSAKTGQPAGTDHFSWTAALTIDLLEQQASHQKSTKTASKSDQ